MSDAGSCGSRVKSSSDTPRPLGLAPDCSWDRAAPVPGAGVVGLPFAPAPLPNALNFLFSLLFRALGAPAAVFDLVAKFALALLYMPACSRYCLRRSLTYLCRKLRKIGRGEGSAHSRSRFSSSSSSCKRLRHKTKMELEARGVGLRAPGHCHPCRI
jgi:hypothetical protein